MASSGIDFVGTNEKAADMEKTPAAYDNEPGRRDSIGRRVSTANTAYDSTHRKLKARHIQLIGIGFVHTSPTPYHYSLTQILAEQSELLFTSRLVVV